jgi:hypothetical protein
MPDSLFAVPWTVQAADCHWYHTMDIPGHGSVKGHWDLREQTDAYLGGVASLANVSWKLGLPRATSRWRWKSAGPRL